MRGAALLLAVTAASLVAGGAEARTCRAPPPDAPAPIAAQVWHEAAEFSFLVGHDLIIGDASMTLVGRLRGLATFDELRSEAAQWGAVQGRLHTAADMITQLRGVVAGLQQLCDDLDAVSLDPAAPFDETTWNSGAGYLEQQLDVTIAAAAPMVAHLLRYADLLRATAAGYARSDHAPNPVIRIGPAPEDVAGGLGELGARWRALLSDLQNARRILPVTPERPSERPLVAITAAMAGIARVAAEAHALSAERLTDAAFRRYETGDYLYDQCPMISDRQWVALVSMYWTDKRRDAMQLGPGVAVSALNAPPGAGGMDRWQFNRIGLGYWMIRHGVDRPTSAALDIRLNALVSYPLTMSPTDGERPLTSGQYWRCAATDQPDRIRLYTLALSEARVVDTPPDTPQANMADAGTVETQHWRVLRR